RPNPITTRDLFVRRFFYERRFSMILDWLREKLVEAQTRLAAVTQQEAEVLDAWREAQAERGEAAKLVRWLRARMLDGATGDVLEWCDPPPIPQEVKDGNRISPQA